MATKRKVKKNSPPRGAKSAAASQLAAEKAPCRVYALKVSLVSGYISDKFAKKNPSVYRTIQIRGDQTLEELHYAIFDAFDRFDEHLYEFQLGKKPMDRSAPRYGVSEFADDGDMTGGVEKTTIESLGLKVRRSFFYWFDFGDDWWHRIEVVAIDEKVPAGELPKVIERVGDSPPQYLDEEEEDGDFYEGSG